LILIALAGSCRARDDGPVAVARAFIGETRAKGCGRAFEYFTPEVQENARQASHRARRNQPYVTDHTLPERIFCSGYDDMLARTVRLTALRADTAYLSVTSASGTRFPVIPFLTDRYKETPTSLTLVKLPAGWRVTRPLVQVHDPRRPEFEFGPITVAAPNGGNPDVRLFQVTGPIVAPPEDVEAVLLDYEAWPRWIPYLVESRVLTADPGRRAEVLYGRYQLTPGGPSADYVMGAEISLRVHDRDFRGFGGGWHTRAGSTPVALPRSVSSPSLTVWGYTLQFRLARWVARPGVHMVDTVNVSLDYAGKPAEWPAELAQKIVAPEFGARMLQGLEREARARASARGAVGTQPSADVAAPQVSAPEAYGRRPAPEREIANPHLATVLGALTLGAAAVLPRRRRPVPVRVVAGLVVAITGAALGAMVDAARTGLLASGNLLPAELAATKRELAEIDWRRVVGDALAEPASWALIGGGVLVVLGFVAVSFGGRSVGVRSVFRRTAIWAGAGIALIVSAALLVMTKVPFAREDGGWIFVVGAMIAAGVVSAQLFSPGRGVYWQLASTDPALEHAAQTSPPPAMAWLVRQLLTQVLRAPEADVERTMASMEQRFGRPMAADRGAEASAPPAPRGARVVWERGAARATPPQIPERLRNAADVDAMLAALRAQRDDPMAQVFRRQRVLAATMVAGAGVLFLLLWLGIGW
jgi:hypothetical protein